MHGAARDLFLYRDRADHPTRSAAFRLSPSFAQCQRYDSHEAYQVNQLSRQGIRDSVAVARPRDYAKIVGVPVPARYKCFNRPTDSSECDTAGRRRMKEDSEHSFVRRRQGAHADTSHAARRTMDLQRPHREIFQGGIPAQVSRWRCGIKQKGRRTKIRLRSAASVIRWDFLIGSGDHTSGR